VSWIPNSLEPFPRWQKKKLRTGLQDLRRGSPRLRSGQAAQVGFFAFSVLLIVEIFAPCANSCGHCRREPNPHVSPALAAPLLSVFIGVHGSTSLTTSLWFHPVRCGAALPRCALCVSAVARTFNCACNVVEHSSRIEWDRLSKPVWKLGSGFCSGRPALRDGHLLDSRVLPSRLRAEAWLRGALQQRQALRRA